MGSRLLKRTHRAPDVVGVLPILQEEPDDFDMAVVCFQTECVGGEFTVMPIEVNTISDKCLSHGEGVRNACLVVALVVQRVGRDLVACTEDPVENIGLGF